MHEAYGICKGKKHQMTPENTTPAGGCRKCNTEGRQKRAEDAAERPPQTKKKIPNITPEERNALLEPIIPLIKDWVPAEQLGAAYEAAIIAVDNWDPNKSSVLKSYVRSRINNAIKEDVKKSARPYHLPNNVPVGSRPSDVRLDDPAPRIDEGGAMHEVISDPKSLSADKILESFEIPDKYFHDLTDDERLLCDLLMDGLTQTEIATTLGISQVAVYKRISKLRDKANKNNLA